MAFDSQDPIRPSLLRRLTGCRLRGMESLEADIREHLQARDSSQLPLLDTAQPIPNADDCAVSDVSADGARLADELRWHLAACEPRLRNITIADLRETDGVLHIRLAAGIRDDTTRSDRLDIHCSFDHENGPTNIDIQSS